MSAINYDGRIFQSVRNDPNGDVGFGTRFEYRQEGSMVWATYRGGGVALGTLVATVGDNGQLDMRYQHVTADGTIKTGRCQSMPEVLPDGRLRLAEAWVWTEGGTGIGASTIEEVPGSAGVSPGHVHVRNLASSDHYGWGQSSEGWRLLDRPDLSVTRERMPPGDAERPHLHLRARQLFVVLNGSLELEVGGRRLRLERDDALEIPPRTPHVVRNVSHQDVHFLVISAPSTRRDRVEVP